MGPPKPTISVDTALENWIINTLQPFSVIENRDFQALFQAHTGKVSYSPPKQKKTSFPL